MAAGLLEGLSSKLEVFKGLCSSGDITVEQHAKIDHLSSKSTWHVDPWEGEQVAVVEPKPQKVVLGYIATKTLHFTNQTTKPHQA